MRGAVVGGSGAVNGGYFCRASAEDFDGWATCRAGRGPTCCRISWRSRTTSTSSARCTVIDGPILVRRVAEFDGCTASFVDAATEMGYPWVADLNGASTGEPLPAGVGAVPLNIDGGIRIGPGGAFLQPALDRPNLTLMTDTRVQRVRFDRRRAVGVDCVGPGRARSVLTADRIVLCAGAIGSAQLLMLSGVGPEDVLAAAGIPVVLNLPVGDAHERSSGMGAAGGLDADTRPASARGDAHHAQRSRDQALHREASAP